MLSSQKKMIALRENAETKEKLHAQFAERLKGYIRTLDQYRRICFLDSQSLESTKNHIDALNAILRIFNYDQPHSIYLDEIALSKECMYYDQLMQNIAFKVKETKERASLRNQFEERICGYIRELSNYKAICSLATKDPGEHQCIVGYIEGLQDILHTLRENSQPLYTDEAMLCKDCAYLDGLIQTIVKPRVEEGMALRANLRAQYQERIEELIARLSFLNETAHTQRAENIIANIKHNELHKLRDNYGILADPTRLNDACELLEMWCGRLEKNNKESSSVSLRK